MPSANGAGLVLTSDPEKHSLSAWMCRIGLSTKYGDSKQRGEMWGHIMDIAYFVYFVEIDTTWHDDTTGTTGTTGMAGFEPG